MQYSPSTPSKRIPRSSTDTNEEQIGTPSRHKSSKRSRATTASDVDTCSPIKRRRSSRTHHVSTLNYDLKYHPLDVVTRPKETQRRLKARLKAAGTEAEVTSGNDSENNQAHGNDCDIEEAGKDSASNVVEKGPKRAEKSARKNFGGREAGCRRSGRHSSSHKSPPLYDMSWHPADDVIRPQNAAARHKRAQIMSNDCFNNHETSNSIEVADSAYDKSGLDGMDSSSKNITTTRVTPRTFSPVFEGQLSHSTLRRSSRARPDGPLPDYSTRFHPVDFILRPSAAAKHVAMKSRRLPDLRPLLPTSALKVVPDAHCKQRVPAWEPLRVGPALKGEMNVTPQVLTGTASISSGQASNTSDLQRLHSKANPLNWNLLPEIDQCVYLQQKGAPSNSHTLPMDWQEMFHRLFAEGLTTMDQVDSPKAIEWITVRYEQVRIAIQAFFRTQQLEPTDNKQWTMFYTEGLDIYSLKPGRRYFRHQEETIVHPQISRIQSPLQKELCPAIAPLENVHDPVHAQDSTPPLNLDLEYHQSNWYPARADDGFDQILRPFDFGQPVLMATSPEKSPSLDINQAEAALVDNMRTMATLIAPIFENQRHDSLFDGWVEYPDSSQDHSSSNASKSSSHVPSAAPTHLALPKRAAAGLQAVGNNFTLLTDEAIPSQWRSNRRKQINAVNIHEDDPDRNSDVNRIVANHPASPGTDIPKENFSSQERIETSEEMRTSLTPRSRFGGIMNVTPRPVAPHRSIFGGD